jgi:hypothetical protein
MEMIAGRRSALPDNGAQRQDIIRVDENDSNFFASSEEASFFR